jgi:hypothetical protein
MTGKCFSNCIIHSINPKRGMGSGLLSRFLLQMLISYSAEFIVASSRSTLTCTSSFGCRYQMPLATDLLQEQFMIQFDFFVSKYKDLYNK